jgi:hypothetical protein
MMKGKAWPSATLPALLLVSGAVAQPYPVVDKVAAKVVEHYQSATCEQLAQERAAKAGQPKSPTEQRAIQMLHEDAGMRAEFFSKVSAPIVQKMFECGMIP